MLYRLTCFHMNQQLTNVIQYQSEHYLLQHVLATGGGEDGNAGDGAGGDAGDGAGGGANDTAAAAQSSSSSSTGLVVGIVVPLTCVLLLLVGGALWWYKRRKKPAEDGEIPKQGTPAASTTATTPAGRCTMQ